MANVYLFTGFLGSGKTRTIKDFIKNVNRKDEGNTLLIVCEQGETEYTEELPGLCIRYVEDEEELTYERVMAWQEETDSTRVIVEYNGMWNPDRPKVIWDPEEILETNIIDAPTFEMYINNLKTLISDKIRSAYLIVFLRCDAVMDKLSFFKRSVRALNSKCGLYFHTDEGRLIEDMNYELPYDANAVYLDIDDDTFAAFYLDSQESPDKYTGKEVTLKGMVMSGEKREDNSFILGRMALTCCSEDLTPFGFICIAGRSVDINPGDWLELTAEIDTEYSAKYKVHYPVLRIEAFERCEPGLDIINIL
ncbi:MAG: hypothetical protein K5745_00610 [Saccharofermentans sp.]|nr:hypothetical protein [Saccharofermentans sp.]